ncbi:MAG TPA: DUF72 domain-containing protein [Anaerolineales bacterium]|nr:DUF72 domain-containing protein [Anaerolineales bacterium]
MNLYLGCPIWAYKDWVGNFYPEGTKAGEYLREYARRLSTVEGNTTFYAVPAQDTLLGWVAVTPETFRFCPKLPRTISHAGKLEGKITQALQFCKIMSQLGERLGPIFLQLPPRYPPGLREDLEAFLSAWPRQFQLAVEVRHLAWFDSPHNEYLNEVLARHDMARVVIDTRPIRGLQGDAILAGSVYQRLLQARQRKPDLPILPEITASFIFLRYIGHPQMELNGPYLKEWADHLGGWLDGETQAYVFCHCPDERLDPWLCRDLHRRVAKRIPLPPLPWDEADANIARQGRLF